MLKLYNTLTGMKEEFKPIQPDRVMIYTCGPTVYDYAHIGNFRTFVAEDLLRRYLRYKGYQVFQVMNITDVDDKTIRGARERGISLKEYTGLYQKAFFEDIDALNIERAEVYPAATQHVDEMVSLIKMLMERGHTYQAEGSIYFKISTFPRYGRLSGITLQGEFESEFGRVDADEYGKENPRDFALWKAWREEDGDVYWDTELGRGRPGWHMECSAMSMKYLGNHFDIHAGGVDNMFPHHENEIAQSECATGEKFVNYWFHCQYLLVNNMKMSKSLGNFYTLRDLLEMGYRPAAIRHNLLSTHYRQQHNFTLDDLKASEAALQRLSDFMARLRDSNGEEADISQLTAHAKEGFERGLDDDLNISQSLASIFDLVREVNTLIDQGRISRANAAEISDLMGRFDTVLGLLGEEEVEIEDEIKVLLEEREAARSARDFARADSIRDKLRELGYMVEDTPGGPRLKRAW